MEGVKVNATPGGSAPSANDKEITLAIGQVESLYWSANWQEIRTPEDFEHFCEVGA